MKRKGKLWLADWRDSQGTRKRKGFPTKHQAQAHSRKMSHESAAKKPSARQRRGLYHRVG